MPLVTKLQRYVLVHAFTSWLLPFLLLSGTTLAIFFYALEHDNQCTHFRKTLDVNAVQFSLLAAQAELVALQNTEYAVAFNQVLTTADERLEQFKQDWNLLGNLQTQTAVAEMDRLLAQWKEQRAALAALTTQAPNEPGSAHIAGIRQGQVHLLKSCDALGSELAFAQAGSTKWYSLLIGTLSLLLLALLFRLYSTYNTHFRQPLARIEQVAAQAALGNVSHRVEYNCPNRLGRVATTINGIIEHQRVLVGFIEQIRDGNFDLEYQHNEQDRLGHSLWLMRNKLLKVSEEEKTQRWTNEGYTRFAELLRVNSTNVQALGDAFLLNLIKYLDINQGALFVLRSEDPNNIFLERTATYAWERKKWVQQQWSMGEGLVGQAAQEGETLYITDIPEQYVSITSGLGKANPRALLIVPLKTNTTMQGILELASLSHFEPHKIAFVEKLAENLAATLSTVKNNERTHLLLQESRQLNDHLKSQEEMLRQNAEEMQAVQEDMLRKEKELALQGEILRQKTIELQEAKDNLSRQLDEAMAGMKDQLRQMEAEKGKNMAILEGCVDGVITFDQRGNIEFFNRVAEEMWNLTRAEVLGKSIQTLVPLRLVIEEQAFAAFYQKSNQEKPVDVRTEIVVTRPDGETMDVLFTLTHAQIGEEYTFTAFVQRVSVELF